MQMSQLVLAVLQTTVPLPGACCRYAPWTVSTDTARHLGLPPDFASTHATASRIRKRAARNARGGSRSSGQRGSDTGEDEEEGDGEEEEQEEEQAPLAFAHELPDDKLLALLAACPRTPRALRQ